VSAKQASTSWASQRENSGSWEIRPPVSDGGCSATEHQEGTAKQVVLLYASATAKFELAAGFQADCSAS
jgi:hypothetical protein